VQRNERGKSSKELREPFVWTADEDFSVLLRALSEYERAARSLEFKTRRLPKLTGVGIWIGESRRVQRNERGKSSKELREPFVCIGLSQHAL
jgi:hypothetical protein